MEIEIPDRGSCVVVVFFQRLSCLSILEFSRCEGSVKLGHFLVHTSVTPSHFNGASTGVGRHFAGMCRPVVIQKTYAVGILALMCTKVMK